MVDAAQALEAGASATTVGFDVVGGIYSYSFIFVFILIFVM